jgi:hypothetical protein
MDTLKAPITLMRTNQPDGFDCPGCAWPDKEHKSTFQFCENGAKAVTWEATNKRVTPEFFANHPVATLLHRSDYELEDLGRLTHPLVYDHGSDTYKPVEWEHAFARIGEILRGLEPNQVEFYTSGRASNEAAYLYQLFARALGTNNFPDCSNMCHEPTSVGLPRSIGMGKGSVSLDDFMSDRRLLRVTMTAFDLGGEEWKGGFIRKVLEEAATPDSTFLERLNNPAYTKFAQTFAFEDGTLSLDADKIEQLGANFETAAFRIAVGDVDENMRLSLNYQQKIVDTAGRVERFRRRYGMDKK